MLRPFARDLNEFIYRLPNYPDFIGILPILKIPNPDQYEIGIEKIPIVTSFLLFPKECLWYLHKNT